MDQERFRQIDALLDEVIDLAADEREKFLEARCGADAALKNEVRRLLARLENGSDFIEKPDFTPVKKLLGEDENEAYVGAKIGAYRLKKLLGRGGMGAVYLASRIDDFEREVAVKLIPPFSNRPGAAENFRRERQILARLAHPSIAQILDGGTAPDGTPFIVMEFVDGRPLNEFCRLHGLSTRAKVVLFQDVCRAVTFAHQNFIVHRDLKPNNILVTPERKPKLLDFGIAKLLNAETLDFAENKTLEAAALTPEYASPEQFSGANITAASDVYSLGVCLYELLTGTRPFDFRGRSLTEILRIIQTESPRAPSAAGDGKSRAIDAELDAVVLKALAKTPAERYQSVEDFRADLENYLENQPVSARPATRFYRFRKYLERRKFETLIAAVFVLILLGWLVTAILQARRAERQARENRRSAYSAEMILAANEFENSNLIRLREIVEKYEPREGEEDLRGFEWYFLDNLLNPAAKVATFQHPDEIWNAEFSPDGRLIATACNDNRARVWDVADGRMIETAEQKGAWKVSFFPDGQKFAVASSSNSTPLVKIYETATARELLTFRGHTKRVRAVDVAPDGKTVATGSQDGQLIVWDAATGAELKRFSFATAQKGVEIYDVEFSKNGDRLAVLGYDTLAVFDTRDWRKIQADPAAYAEKNVLLTGWKIVFSPLEKTLAIGTYEGNVAFIDAETLAIGRVLKLHQSNVKSLAFTTDGKTLVTGSGDRTVKFVDVATGEVAGELRGHFSGVHEVAVSPDGSRIATASADFNLNFWNAEAVSKANAILTNSSIFAFSRDGAKVFDWSNASFEIAGRTIAEKRRNFAAKTRVNAFSIDYSGDRNQLVLGERDGFLTLLDAADGRELKRWKASDRSIFAVAFANGGRRIVAGYDDGRVRCFDADTGALIYELENSPEIVKSIAAAPDGRTFAVAGNDKLVRLYDSESGTPLAVLAGNRKPVLRVAFSDDGRLLASAGADDVVRVWRTADRQLVHELSGMSGGVFAVAFTPDGRRLATASDLGVIRLWNLETGEQVLAFTASQKQLNLLKFTADGETLLSVDATGKIGFWSAKR
ncbi:MAG: serine/threonine protein kinase [Acidobacteria bacterium]|nr:serine/threonine protein kinase [Acidobacteriota bacterium]